MPRWIVLRERSKLRWGGDLRRHYILSTLASRSDALDVDGWSLAAIRKALPDGRRLPWTREPWVAAATMLGLDALEAVRGRACPFVMDYHDDPIAQNAALGLEACPRDGDVNAVRPQSAREVEVGARRGEEAG